MLACHVDVDVQETLDEWLTCQRNWMYLETIFGSADIIRQLPGMHVCMHGMHAVYRTVCMYAVICMYCVVCALHAWCMHT